MTGAGPLKDLSGGAIAVLPDHFEPADRTDGNDQVATMQRRPPHVAAAGVLSERLPGQQPRQRASGKLGVVDVHIELVRVREDGLE